MRMLLDKAAVDPAAGPAAAAASEVATAAAAGAQRRKEPRVPCSKAVALLPCAAEELWQFKQGWVVDCSPHGIGLHVAAPMQAGEQFLVKLKLEQLMLVLYTVKHCRPAPTGRYHVGAEFSGFVRTGEAQDADALFRALMATAEAPKAK